MALSHCQYIGAYARVPTTSHLEESATEPTNPTNLSATAFDHQAMNYRLISKSLGVVALLIGASMIFSLPWAFPRLGFRKSLEQVAPSDVTNEPGFETAGLEVFANTRLERFERR